MNGVVDFTAIIKTDSSKALFALLDSLPLKTVTSFLSILLVSTFFITSSDSGSLVVDYMTSGGEINTPVSQKIFWASMEGLIAIALILGGGLSALQASISTGFPFFAIILVLMTYSLYNVLQTDDQCGLNLSYFCIKLILSFLWEAISEMIVPWVADLIFKVS